MPRTLRLASASSERRAILQELGFVVEVCPVDFDETPLPGEKAGPLVKRLAEGKLKQAGLHAPWTIAADTVVEISGKIKGKPRGVAEARKTLFSLRGADIVVWTATVIGSSEGKVFSNLSSAKLKAKNWTSSEFENYLKSGLWQGRAGGFSISHEPHPVILLEGQLDVVRGLNGEMVISTLGEAA